MAVIHWKSVLGMCFPLLLLTILISVVSSTPTRDVPSSHHSDANHRQPRTWNMGSGMDMLRDMIQNGMAFRPNPAAFPGLNSLFRTNGTQLTWVPLGSLMFNNNGKIIGG